MPLFYLCLALLGVILAMLAMFFGYSLKLDQRTVKLERKNGKELAELAELKTKVQELEKTKQNKENHHDK
jgi:hypothetical protein